ncbi:ribosome-inactivating family protein [Streptomyces sp. NPDC089922]|uniref:ribosome-inactivating family protein n=1 Tax=Streptomyces sp. NPDC089922 TaxID=3155189 RepID=UPI00341321A3
MNPLSTGHRVFRRLAVLLLALLSTAGLLEANATPAHATTPTAWSVITWNIDDLQYTTETQTGAQNYRNLIQNIRGLAAADQRLGTGAVVHHLQETENRPNRFIEVRILDHGRHDLSLYFQTRDLYLVGIAAGGVRYQFATTGDESQLAQAYRNHYRSRGEFRAIGYDENYNNLASRQVREAYEYTPSEFYRRLNRLADINRQNANSRRSDFAYVIQGTSEAVRFDWIRDRIHQTIRNGISQPDPQGNRYTYLGSYGVDLTLNWTNVSEFVYRILRNAPAAVTIAGVVYRTLGELLYGQAGSPGIGGLVAAVSKRGS